MNERIRELESQAWEQVTRANGLVRTEDFNQKFAELIVQECASLFKDDLRPMGDFTERACRRAIKEHFGVQE